MAAYHQAAYTLRPEVLIPETPMPAVGVDEYGTGDAVKALSGDYVGANAIWVNVNSLVNGLVTVYLAYHLDDPLPEGAQVRWQWGDGSSEVASDQEQEHQYTRPGQYGITATITRPPESTMEMAPCVVVDVPSGTWESPLVGNPPEAGPT